MRQLIKHFDDAVDTRFDALRGRPRADLLFYVASEAADYSMAWHALGVLMAAANPRRRSDAVRMAVTLGAESLLVNGVIKKISRRERPPLLEAAAYLVRRPTTMSFPSGHASSAAVMAVLMSDATPRLRPLWVTLAAIVAASRVHNRMHHASDVVAGAALGAAIALMAKRMEPLR
ncbi:MAG: phosphatase PAP2 family protein [Acidimicrobiales bacterium]